MPPSYSRRPEQEAESPEAGPALAPWMSALGSPGWTMGAQGTLGNAEINQQIQGGVSTGGYFGGLQNLGLWGAGAGMGGGLGLEALYFGGFGGSRTRSQGADGSVTDAMNLQATPFGAFGLGGGLSLGGLGQQLVADPYLARTNLGGSTTYGADGALTGANYNADFTPIGANNLHFAQQYGLGAQSSVGAQDVYWNRWGLRGGVNQADDGTIRSDHQLTQRMGFDNAALQGSGPLGHTALSGSMNIGPTFEGGSSYNPQTGAWEARGGFVGGGMQITNVDLQAGFLGDNVQLNGHMGEFNDNNTYRGALGWDPTQGQGYANGLVSTGFGVTDARAGYDLGGGALTGQMGADGFSYGNTFEGEARVGADGLHLRTTDLDNLGQNRGVRFGGLQANGLSASQGIGDLYRTDAAIGHLSTDTVLDAAYLDVTGDGLNGGFQQLRTGGMRAQDVSTSSELFGQRASVSAGELSNDLLFNGANLQADANGVRGSLDQFRGGGMRALNIDAQQHLLGTDANLHIGDLSNDVILNGAHFNRDPLGLSGDMGFQMLDFGGIRANDVRGDFANQTLGVSGNYGGSFSSMNTIEGANASWDMTSLDTAHLRAHADHVAAPGWALTNANVGVDGPWGTHVGASLEDLHQGLDLRDANVSLDGDGLNADVARAQWDTLAGRNMDINADLGPLYQANAHIGEGYYNRFSGENLHVGLDGDGLGASGDNLAYSYLGFNDVQMNTSQLGGALTSDLSADRLRGAGGEVGHLDFQTDLLNSSLSAQDIHAYGLDAENLDVGVGSGPARVGVGADQLQALDLRVGELQSSTSLMGTQGDASLRDARLDALNIEGGHAGLSWDGQEVLGVAGDLRSGGGVDAADANWDLWSGTAGASFDNAQWGQQVNDASINLFGTEIALPDAGYNLNASGGADVDLLRGAANANLSLAGSSVNLAGMELTAPEWAQASAGVDLSELAANVNLGGENGVGADLNLSEGNLDLNLFGYEVDVDEGLSDAWDFVTSW